MREWISEKIHKLQTKIRDKSENSKVFFFINETTAEVILENRAAPLLAASLSISQVWCVITQNHPPPSEERFY